MTPEHTDSFMRMPSNWVEWLAVISSVLAIIEHYRRSKHDKLIVGFLHGLKPMVAILRDRDTTTKWQYVLDQINNMLSRLEPHPVKKVLAWLRLTKGGLNQKRE
jgi:hypothetical protein